MSEINFDEISYYLSPTKQTVSSWDQVPIDIKKTYEKLGIPEAERKFLAGVSAQLESEVIYEKFKTKCLKFLFLLFFLGIWVKAMKTKVVHLLKFIAYFF